MFQVTPLGENPWNLMPGFCWTLSCRHFPFPEFALHPLAVINCSLEYAYTLNPVVFPNE
jgi:hypothetical protein